jgi:hypothetical protein
MRRDGNHCYNNCYAEYAADHNRIHDPLILETMRNLLFAWAYKMLQRAKASDHRKEIGLELPPPA